MTETSDPGQFRPNRRRLLGAGGALLGAAGVLAAASPATAATANVRSSYDVRDFGAQGDGATDDTAAIQAAIAAAADAGGGIVLLPAGTYAIGGTLQIRSSNIGIQGVGMASQLMATAADGDMIYAGRDESGPAVQNVFFEHFAMRASAPKTSGAAIFCEFAERFRIHDVKAAPQEVASNLYDGFVFRYYDTCVISAVSITAAHTGLMFYGRPDQSYGAGLWLNGGSRVLGCETGVHIAGSSGGIAFEDVDIIGNDTNVRLDTSGSGTINREIFFDQCWIDSAGHTGVEIMGGAVAVLHFNNTWVASSGLKTQGHPDGSNIHAHPDSIGNPVSVIVDGCRIFNANGSGLIAESGAWTITGCDVEFNGKGTNGGYGILLTGRSVSDVIISANNIRNNGWPVDADPRPLGEGVHIESGVDAYVVTGNIIRGNGTAQLVDRGGPDKVVRDNLLRASRPTR
ncbi:MAG TPA: glycosyl hydrolase family 28-related protein [Mycobacteriales bacterium]|nr:glycosyl hydrolase family 28-related protein [Mycobacteriales bacterium]